MRVRANDEAPASLRGLEGTVIDVEPMTYGEEYLVRFDNGYEEWLWYDSFERLSS